MATCPHCQKPLPAFAPGARAACPACGKDVSASGAAAGGAPASDAAARTVVHAVGEDRTVLSEKPQKPPDNTILSEKPQKPADNTILSQGPQKPADRKPRVLEATLKDGVREISPSPAAPAGPKDPLIGKTMGNSEILSVLGKGAMGVVYKARQVALDRIVAVKTIRPEFCTDEQLLERFQREAKTVGRFNTTYVVQVYDVGFAEGQHYIVMEFVPGGSLKSYTQSRTGKRLTVAEAVRFMKHSAEGLLEAERLNIIHRDIKPENLLLDQQGRVKITDFGIAKMLGATVELTGSMGLVGTPLYMSPEQCRGEELSTKSDMYSLGATFYHMLTGTPPCKGESVFDLIQTKTRIERLSPRRDLADGSVPDQLSHVIERLTALKPKDRYGSFAEVLEDLSHIPVVDEGPQGVETKVPARRRGRKSPVGAIVGVVVLLAAAGGGAWYAMQPEPYKPPVIPDPGNGSKPVGPEGNGSGEPGSRKIEEPPSRPVDPVVVPGPNPAAVRAAFLKKYAELDQVRKDFAAKGPDAAGLQQVRVLHADASNTPDVDAERKELLALVNDMDHTAQARDSLRRLDVPVFAPPFANLAGHLKALETHCVARPGGGPEQQEWLAAQLKARRSDVQGNCKRGVASALSGIQDLAKAVASNKRQESDLQTTLADLEASARVLNEQLPEGREDWDSLLGAEALGKLREPIAARKALREKIKALSDSATGLNTTAAEFKTARDWTKQGEAWVKDLAAVEATLKTLTTEAGDAPELKEPGDAVKRLRGVADRWKEHAQRMAAVRDDFSSGSHGQLEAHLSAAGKTGIPDTDLEALNAAWSAVQLASKLARKELLLAEAQKELGTATQKLKSVEAPSTWTEECSGLLQQLLAATQNRMARVPGGTVVVAETAGPLAAVEVPGFFMDRTECTVGEFRRFVDACQKEPTKAAQWYGSPADYLRYGQRARPIPATLQDRWPMVEVSWYEARALLRWQHAGKTLPTRAEWWLAAKSPAVGGAHVREFHWGTTKDPSLKELWAGARKNPAVVDDGGLRLLGPGDDPIHHLAGNVAEWLLDLDPNDANRARAFGGDYEMAITPSNRDHFAGRKSLLQNKADGDRLIGFRGVLHPGEILGNRLP